MSRHRPRLPAVDSRRYWRIADGKRQQDGQHDQQRRFEDACRDSTLLRSLYWWPEPPFAEAPP